MAIVALTSCNDGFGIMARVLMPQGRDQALPWGKFLDHIHPRWSTPTNEILVAFALQFSIAAVHVGNATAYYGVSSRCIVFQVICLVLPVALHLPFRDRLNLTYGPWRLPKWLSQSVNVLSLAMYLILIVAMWFPVTCPVTAAAI